MDPEQSQPVRQPGYKRRRERPWVGQLIAAVLLVALGVAAGIIWSRTPPTDTPSAETTKSMPGMPGMAMPGGAAPSGAAKSDEPVEVSLTPEAMTRIGIKIDTVRAETATEGVGVPGTVASNAYRDTKGNALVGGVVRQVIVELGARVRRGEPLAVIFSSDLADAQMKYLSMRATFEADHQKLVRTEKVVALGSASRQELEEVTAMHAGHETELAAARQRLLLLGLEARQVDSLTDASHVVSEVTVQAPANGEGIGRRGKPGRV